MKMVIYEAPEVGVVEITARSIICESGTDANRDNYGTVIALTWD